MAEEDDVRLRFFPVAQDAVMIGVEQAQDGFVSCLSVAVLEDLDRGALGQFLLKFERKPHGPVERIVVAHESAGKADEDVRRRWGKAGHNPVGSCEPWSCCSKRREDRTKRRRQHRESREAGHAGSYLTYEMIHASEGMRQKNSLIFLSSRLFTDGGRKAFTG